MKYSNTAITQLTRWYKQILIKCAIINAAILMGGAFVAAPAMATDVSSWDDLKAGLQAGSDMVMTDDITVEEGLGVTDKNNTIDMGEHFLSGNGGNTEGFSIFGGSLTLTGSGAIAGMDRTGTGAGIFNVQGGSLSLEGANSSFIFADNTSKRGVIQVWESANPSEATVSSNVHSLVFNNNTSDMGGAIYHEQRYSDSNVVSELNGDIIGFEENHAVAGNGGAVLNVVGNISVLGDENSFTGNTRTGSSGEAKFYKRGGGAVANASGESLHDATMIIGKAGSVNTFSENTSDTNGGAIMNRAVDVDKGANLTINGVSTFSENSADMKGGAIYNMRELLTFAPGEHEAEVTINGESTFTGNTAGQLGGAIYNSGDMTIDNATFTKNKTTAVSYATDEEIPTNEPAQGGAIYNAGSDVVWEGGSDAKFSYNGVLNISNTNFGAEDDATSGNQALQGGAIANAKANGLAGEVTLNNVNFYNNKTLEDTDGGFSSLGGAIWNSGEMTVNGSTTLKGNTAEGYAAEGGAVYNSGDLTFNDAVTFSGNTVEDTDGANGGKGGAISNHDALTFKKMATFTDNKAVGDGQTSGGALYNEDTVDFQKGATFSGNEAMYGGAIFNDGQMASPVLTVTDATFTNNTAGDEGGAIFTLGGTVNINAVNSDVVFSGNTADGQVNDIMNYGGEINLSAASGKTISLEGINGQKAFGDTPTINISGAGNVEVSEYLANHTVNVTEGELHLTTGEENLYKSTVNVADGAIINTIDDVINDYMTGDGDNGVINLADGAKVKGDVDFENAMADKYAASSGTIKYMVANLIGAAGNGTKTIQVAGNGSTINISEAKFNAENGLTFESSGAADGMMIVNGMSGGIEDAADASSNVETVDYDFSADESVDNNKEFHHVVTVNGDGVSTLTLNADLGTAAGATTTYNDMIFAGTGALNNNGTLHINDSDVAVDVNNYGRLISDPTSYSGTVTNEAGAYASFDADTFESTAVLANSGDAYLKNNVTFDAGASITGNGDLYLMSGTTAFNNTANTNDAYLASGAKFSGALVGGSLDTQNGAIDTGLGTIQNADLYMDAKLSGTGSADAFTATTGSTIKEITILGNDYNATKDELKIAVGAATLDDDVVINGANYYTSVTKDAEGNLVFSDKLINTSTIQGTGDGSTTWTGNVVLGSKADNTTIGTPNAKIVMDESDKQVDITAGTATKGAMVGLDEGSVNLETANSTSKGEVKVSSDATNNKAEMKAVYNSTDTASVVVQADSTNGAKVTATAANGFVVSDGTNNATLKGTAAGLNVAEGITVGTAGTYGINSTGVAKVNGLTVGTTSYGITNTGAASVASLSLGGTAVTSTAAELNILDGATVVTSELNQLHGSGVETADLTKLHNVTASADDLNKLSGNAVTAADFTKLHNVNATAAEINQLAGSGVVTADLTKLHAVTASAADLNKLAGNEVTAADFTKLHGITADAAELNVLDGITASTTELNQLTGSGVVTADLTKLHAVTASADDLNKLTGNAVTAADFTKLHGITADATELNVLDGITASTTELNQLTGSGVVTADLTKLHAVTATADELNKLAGNAVTAADFTKLHAVTADADELNILDGATVTTAELNVLDGITASTAELNVLDGITASTAELNLVDGMTAVDDGTFADTAATTFATNATVNTAKTQVETKLAAGATGYDINAKTLKVQGNDVLSTANVAPNYTYTADKTIADVTTYVSTNGAKFANVASTAGLIETVMSDKEDWIGRELGYDPKTTDANTVLSAAGFTDMDGDTKVSFKDAVVELHTDLGDVTDFTGSTTGNISNSAPGVNPNATTASGAIANIDATMGQIHGLASTITAAQGAGNLQPGSTVSGHLVALAGAIGDRSAYGTATYLNAGETVATSLLALDDALGDLQDEVGMPQTAAATTGQFVGRKIGDDINLVDAIDELGVNMVSLSANNVFTGLNTFKNDGGIAIQDGAGANSTRIKATADGLNIDRTVESVGFKITGQAPVVTSIDTDGTTVTSAATAANVMATSATVYNGAQKGLYDGVKVKGDTTTTHTIKTAIEATNNALNALTTTAGNEVDSAKVDVQWNSTDSTLATVLGSGVYTSTNYVAAGDSITTAISALDGQAKANADDIVDINTAITVTADGNYILAANDVKANLGVLDTQVKTNADDIATINTTIGTYGTIVTKDAAAPFTGTTLADVNAYVTAEGTNVADVATTANVINVVMADKEAWIGQELGYDPKTTDANTVLGGEGFTDQDGDSKVSFNDAVVQLKGDITVTTAGNYIAAGEDVAGNLSALDVQVKQNADDIAANAVIGTASASSAGYAATDTVKAAVVAIDAALAVDEGNIATNTANIGTLASLTTDVNTDLVSAINEVDAHADAVQGEVDKIETALGVVNTDGTYKPTALNNNMFENGGTAATSLDQALLNLATNTTTMTGASIDDSGNLKVDYSSNNYVADDTNLVTAVGALDAQAKINADKNTVQDTGMGNLASRIGVTYTATDGSVSATDYAYTNYIADGDSLVTAVGKLDNALHTADSNNAKLDADNIFTGHNTFNNANGITIQDGSAGNSTNITATANGLTVDRNVEATGFKIAGSAPVVTSIDVDGSGVTSAATAANIMATAATVYEGAENGAYTGTKVTGDTTSTTIKQAMSATTAALNNVLTADGSKVDSAKVATSWNGSDSNVAAALGNGVYGSTNKVAAGDSVTTAITKLDTAIGGTVTGTNGNVLAANSINQNLDRIDTNMGNLTALTTTEKGSLVGSINEIVSDITVGAGTYNTISAGANVAANLIALDNVAGAADAKITSVANNIGGTWSGNVFTHSDYNASNKNILNTDNLTTAIGKLDTILGNIASIANTNGNVGGADVAAKLTSVDTNMGNLTTLKTTEKGSLVGSINEVVDDITVAAGTYNVISAGANAGANLQALDAAFTSGAIDAVFNSVTTDSLTIDNAYAITGATTGHLDMGGNTLDNVNGMVLTNGTSDVALTVDGSGNLVADSGFKANSLESVGDLTVGGDASITGDALVGGDLGVTGDASVGGDLDVSGTANVNALEIGATGYGVTSTGAASFDTVEAVNGLTIGSANALTSTTAGQLDMGANDLTNVGSIATSGDVAVGGDFSVAGDSTLTGDLTVSGTTSLKDTDVAGDFSITNATDPSKSVTLDVRGLTVDGTGVDALQVNGGMLSTDVIASTDGFKVLSTTGVDTYQTVFDIDDYGSITSDVFSTDNTAAGNTVTIGRADDSTATTVKGTLEVTGDTTLDADLTVSGLTTLDPTNGMQFGATGQNVVSIDNDGSAVAADDATALATGATIKAGAEDADYTTVGPNITAATTIGGAINTLDTLMGDVSTVDVNGYPVAPATRNLSDAISALNDNMEAVLGAVYKADGTYDDTQLAADGFVTGQTDLTASLKDYAANVETATGGTFDATGAWTATVDNTGGSTSYAYVASADLMDAIDQVASHVGTAAELAPATTPVAGGLAGNGVAATNTVNANIGNLNAALGDIATLNTATFDNLMTGGSGGTQPETAVEAMLNIDTTLGEIHALKSNSTLGAKSNLAADGATTSVSDHLDSLDSAIGDRTLRSSNAAIDAAMSGTSVAAGLQAAGNAIGDMQFTTTRYVATGSDLSDAVRTLDSNLYRVETDLKDLRKEFKNGMASMSAMSALVPNPRATGNTSLSVGTGMYDGHTAVAVGGFHYITDNVLLNAGASWGNANDLAYRMGITWSW